MTIAPDARFRRNSDCFGTDVGGSFVLLATDLARYLELNPTATMLWDLLETPHSLEELCTVMEASFDVDPERCRTEVKALLCQCLDLRLIVQEG